MKRKFVYSLTAMAAATVMTFGVFSLAACGDKLHTHIDEDGNGKCDICDKDMPAHTHTDEDGDGKCDICKAKMEKPLTDEPLNATTVIADFTAEGENEEIYASDGWSNMGSFNCEWDTGRVAFEDGYAKLTIAENPDGSEADCNEYFGGEMRTRGYYGYGDYEVSMKPAKKVGTASTFFVCTGDYDYQPGSSTPNPWDEVDIEFLGQDTTKVQFNYFVNGVGTGVHEYVYDLGFDASEDFHTYGFRWAEDHITWFVDGEPVYRVDASADNPMPSTAGRMLMNYWCGNSKGYGWMGQYSDPGDEGAEYQWIKTSAAKAYDESEAGPPAETPDIEGVDFTDVDMSAVNGADDGRGAYAVTKAEDAFNVTYTDLAGNYQNVAFTGMDALAQANNLFRAEITNNGEQAVGVRIDVMSTEEVNANHKATNLLAMQDGEAVTTDLEWGGSLFTVGAGDTIEIVIEYDNKYQQASVQFMLDSASNGTPVTGGDVTISGLAFGANGNVYTGETVLPPEPSENSMISFSTDHEYVISEAGVPSEEVNITYSGVKNDYHCVYGAITTADTQDKNTFTFTVVNNSADKPVEFRIDLQNASGENVVTAISGPSAWGLDDGNFYFRVAAGATETITVTFSDSLTGVLLYIDSTIYIEGDDAHTTTYSGDITLKDFKFTNVA